MLCYSDKREELAEWKIAFLEYANTETEMFVSYCSFGVLVCLFTVRIGEAVEERKAGPRSSFLESVSFFITVRVSHVFW